MSILELKKYGGLAQVMGKVREVEFDGEMLHIACDQIADANEILNHLAIGLQSVVLPGGKQTDANRLPPMDEMLKGAATGRTSTAAPNVSNPPRETAAPAAEASKASAKGKKAAAKPAEDDLPGDLGHGGKGPAPVTAAEAAAAADAVEEAPPSPAGNGQDALVTKLAGLARFADVVATLRDGGMEDPAQIITTCQKLREKVKAIGRVGTADAIAERVPRVLEALAAQD
jgi:hypothetical protein